MMPLLKRSCLMLFALLATFHPTPSRANDSVAHLGAGGLVLARSADIEMRSEDLYISFDRIHVRYRFFNRSNRDIETLVAFPMPDLKPTHEGNDYSLPTDDPRNFLAFRTTVDGVPVLADLQQKVFALGIDRTDEMIDLALPFAPHLQQTMTALDQLHPDHQKRLQKLGLVKAEYWDVGQGLERHLMPTWTLKSTFYWTQIFPANTEVRIEHEYQPSVGASAMSMIGYAGAEFPSDSEMVKDYCIDEGYFRAARKAQARLAKAGGYMTEKRLEYILETGANWSGPIGDFRLVVDKGSRSNLVSFCGTGLTKFSPTQFEMRRTNYWPSQNLHVLLLEPVMQNQ